MDLHWAAEVPGATRAHRIRLSAFEASRQRLDNLDGRELRMRFSRLLNITACEDLKPCVHGMVSDSF